MTSTHYERFSAQDATFLWAERPNQPMHVGAIGFFDAAPLTAEDGSFRIKDLQQAVNAALHWIPRYRQKVAFTPVEGWPVWIDDPHFKLPQHIRHIAVPKPGNMDQIRELAARILARPLDPRHPLWEMWIVEGVADGQQFALFNKTHHCMIDGAAGADLSQILLSPSPSPEIGKTLPHHPRPAPATLEYLQDYVARTVERPATAIWNTVSDLLGNKAEQPSTGISERSSKAPDLPRRIRALTDLLSWGFDSAPDCPINGDLGPHRDFEWLTMPLDDVRELRKVLGCSINDVVLATVSGAARRYLERRRVDIRDLDFRIAAPVNTRSQDDHSAQGNHVSTWIVPLELGCIDPIDRLRRIQKHTEARKREDSALGLDTLMGALEWLPSPLVARSVDLAGAPANMVVTNVPGPQFPLYMLGAKLHALYPVVPLLPGSGLGVALFGYEGKLCWGFAGDHRLVPDLADFARDITHSFEELRNAVVSHFIERRTGSWSKFESTREETTTKH